MSAAELPSFSTGRFRAERQADWIAFDLLLTKLEKRGAKALTADELQACAALLHDRMTESVLLARAE